LIERWIYDTFITPPKDQLFAKPLNFPAKIPGECFSHILHAVSPRSDPWIPPGGEKIVAHLSGYGALDNVQVHRLVTHLGGRIDLPLRKGVTHVIHASVDEGEEPVGPKIDFARKHGIAVVGWKWLLEFGEAAAAAQQDQLKSSKLVEVEERRLAKGKGREVEILDAGPTDITNRPGKF
jgi:hypothetical protein